MKLRANFNQMQLDNDQSADLLHRLIANGQRNYLESGLRRLEIPGRTKIYKAFGWSWNYYNNGMPNVDETEKDGLKADCIRAILSNSHILDWVQQYCKEYTLNNFLNVAAMANIDLDGLNIRIERYEES